MLLAEALIEGMGSSGQWWIHVLFEIVISLLAIFLILLVLVQRGRGGGLAGALGGMGGQSAFGTRAGDTFTWITYTVAAVWIILAAITIKTFTDPPAEREAAKAEQLDEVPTDSAQAVPVGESDSTAESSEPDSKTDEAQKPDEKAPQSATGGANVEDEPKLKSSGSGANSVILPSNEGSSKSASDVKSAEKESPAPSEGNGTPPESTSDSKRIQVVPTQAIGVAVRRRATTLLMSMTGHGEAHRHEKDVVVAVEVRTINNRYFKLSVRAPENYAAFEPQVEDVVRQQVRRGTVQVTLRVDRDPTPDDFQLNEVVLASYWKQLERMHEKLHMADPVRLEQLLILPGVVNEKYSHDDAIESERPIVRQALLEALTNLDRMRRDEGKAMTTDLTSNCQLLSQELTEIEQRAPIVVDNYRHRITERLNKLLSELGVSVTAADVVREVGLFADRSDISEEMVRLRSHLEQFSRFMDEADSNGRKLDFLIQEMFRETNTIGSKSNDAAIARHVVEMKTAIERMREMIQNVE